MNESDFRKLIAAEITPVYRLACHLSRDRQEAEDLVQETYLHALRSASTFTLADFGVRPWLFKILHNVILSRGARRQRERAVLDGFAHQSANSDADIMPMPLNCAIDWERIDERLKSAISELPMAFRETFLLSVVEGLKYREIAEVTHVPVGTVMSRLSRAKALLATWLQPLAIEQRRGQPVDAHRREEAAG